MNETAEIRCELKREGRWEDTRYTIRWFLFDGEGTLKLDDGTALLPMTATVAERDVPALLHPAVGRTERLHRLGWRTRTDQMVELEFDFNADNDKEDGYGTE